MIDKNEKKEYKKPFAVFGGIAIALLSMVMIMNVGYPAKAITFIFSYLFGSGSYFLYACFYVFGMGMIFHSRIGFFKKFRNLSGLLFIFFSYLIICSACYSKTNPDDFSFNTIYGADVSFAKGYFGNDSFLGLFSEHAFAGGVVGYGISDLLKNSAGIWCSILVGVVCAILGIFIIVYPYIFVLIKKIQVQKDNFIDAQNEQIADDSIESYGSAQSGNYTRVRNYNVIRGAKKVDDDYVPDVSTESLNKSSSLQGEFLEGYYSSKDSGRLQKAMFYLNGGEDDFLNTSSLEKQPATAKAVFPDINSQETFVQPAQEQNKLSEDARKIREEENQSFNHEQLDIFENQQKINEELVCKKPEFASPVAVNTTPVRQPEKDNSSNVIVISDPSQKRPIKWIPPTDEFLTVYENQDKIDENKRVAEERIAAINEVFDNLLNGGAFVDGYTVGPGVTRFNIRCNTNTPVRKVEGVIRDVSIRLDGAPLRFESVVMGQNTSGLEAPNAEIATVSFKEIYEGLPDVKKHPLSVGFGKNISGKIVSADFNEFPHLLVAGTTGSGKSVFVNSIICTLIMRNSPDDLRLVLIDPKKIEMSRYKDMPHLLCPVITEAGKAKAIMDKLVDEMEDRYEKFMEADNCTDIKDYNQCCGDFNMPKMPYIIAVLDEYADLVNSCKEIAKPVVLLGQKARACGIHVLISTQRPSTNVIDGVIKANLPTRVALSVSSQVDSMTVLGEAGAEKLLGKGDMLVMSPLVSRSGFTRVQGCFMNKHEMNEVVRYLKENYVTYYDEKFMNLEDEGDINGKNAVNAPEFSSRGDGDEETKYQEVKEWVMAQSYMSMSKIQRGCAVGFNRAGRFFERLQDEGIVDTATEGNKGCRVLVRDIDETNSDVPTSIDMSER